MNSKRQFSKGHVIFADALVAFVWISNIFLAWFNKQIISDLAVTIVTVYGGFATGGYFAQNCIRDVSLNSVKKTEIENGGMTDEN